MLRLVIPKGSLEKSTLELFSDADLPISRGSVVDYKGNINDPRIESVRVLRPQEIGSYVSDGLFDIGITGRDWIEETESNVQTLCELHFQTNVILLIHLLYLNDVQVNQNQIQVIILKQVKKMIKFLIKL